MNVTLLGNKGLLNYGAEVPDNDCDKAISFGCYMIRPETLNAYREKQADDFEVMLTMAWNEGTIAQLTVAPNSEGVGFRSTQIGTGKWLPWKQLATAEPPQIFDLPLSDGFAPWAPCTYSKNSFDMVTVDAIIKTVDEQDTINGRVVVGILPEGYRPKNTCTVPVFARKNDNSKAFVGDVFIAGDGILACDIFCGDDFAGIIAFQCVFIAGQP